MYTFLYLIVWILNLRQYIYGNYTKSTQTSEFTLNKIAFVLLTPSSVL